MNTLCEVDVMMFRLVEDLTRDVIDEINCHGQFSWIGNCRDKEMWVQIFV